jgi:lysine 2,3-aminomutase
VQWFQKNITTVQELARHIPMEEEQIARLEEIARRFPISIPEYYLSLVDPGDPDDPIRRMCVPTLEESIASGEWDTSGEKENTVMEGLQHKYKQTALILSTNQCAMYCRHCFRKRMIGQHDDEVIKNFDRILDYIKGHPEIDNILISGGDALFVNDRVLRTYLEQLSELEQLHFIRLGTRIPVTFPQRITQDPELLDILRRCSDRKSLYISTQYNHPRELTPQSQNAISALLNSGVIVHNQTVLLQRVNDDPDTLAALMNGLTRLRVIPYYIFQCRPVSHVKTSFQVPLKRGCEIVEQAKLKCNGYAKRFRYAMSHWQGKIEILGMMNEKDMLFKFHQARNPKDHDRIFTVRIKDDQTWLDATLA